MLYSFKVEVLHSSVEITAISGLSGLSGLSVSISYPFPLDNQPPSSTETP